MIAYNLYGKLFFDYDTAVQAGIAKMKKALSYGSPNVEYKTYRSKKNPKYIIIEQNLPLINCIGVPYIDKKYYTIMETEIL